MVVGVYERLNIRESISESSINYCIITKIRKRYWTALEITLPEMSNCREKVSEGMPRKLTNRGIFLHEEIFRKVN